MFQQPALGYDIATPAAPHYKTAEYPCNSTRNQQKRPSLGRAWYVRGIIAQACFWEEIRVSRWIAGALFLSREVLWKPGQDLRGACLCRTRGWVMLETAICGYGYFLASTVRPKRPTSLRVIVRVGVAFPITFWVIGAGQWRMATLAQLATRQDACSDT